MLILIDTETIDRLLIGSPDRFAAGGKGGAHVCVGFVFVVILRCTLSRPLVALCTEGARRKNVPPYIMVWDTFS